MFEDPELWVAVAFLIFLGILAYFGVPKMALSALDARSDRIKQALDEAHRLRSEAQAVLVQYQQKRAEAEKEAQAIIVSARVEAERLAGEAKGKVEEFIARRTKMAESKIAQAEAQALADVRAAAAQALGDMKAKDATGKLYEMFNDKDAGVIIAAAHALIELGDKRGYNVYYAVLTGEMKSGQGLGAEQKKMLSDPKKLAQFGFEQGIGFIPFAGMGYGAFKMVTKDTTSPVLAAAALVLAKDPDPKSGQALATTASGNKSWIVRAAALNALAIRGETSLLPAAVSGLQDDKEEVRYSAAAAVIRLTDLSARRAPAQRAPASKPAPKKK